LAVGLPPAADEMRHAQHERRCGQQWQHREQQQQQWQRCALEKAQECALWIPPLTEEVRRRSMSQQRGSCRVHRRGHLAEANSALCEAEPRSARHRYGLELRYEAGAVVTITSPLLRMAPQQFPCTRMAGTKHLAATALNPEWKG